MKKKSIIIVIVLIIFLSIVYFYLSKLPIEPPKRLANIPKQAMWAGGPDGGSWYQIKKVISKNTFRIKVYSEVNGEPDIDTIFVLNPNCSFEEIDSSLLIKSIKSFDGAKIVLALQENGTKCSLIIK